MIVLKFDTWEEYEEAIASIASIYANATEEAI
jgi:hypothetical protein